MLFKAFSPRDPEEIFEKLFYVLAQPNATSKKLKQNQPLLSQRVPILWTPKVHHKTLSLHHKLMARTRKIVKKRKFYERASTSS